MRLSALAIRTAKPREKAYKLGDGHGLYLLVKPSGTRLWRMSYAHMGRRSQSHLSCFAEGDGCGHKRRMSGQYGS